MDSGCSKHMIGDKSKFLNLEKRKDWGSIAFGDNRKALTKGVGIIGKPNSAQIENVSHVKGLKLNLLRISQLRDNGSQFKFEPNAFLIKEALTRQILFSGVKERNLYTIVQSPYLVNLV